jgi:hypothetical protein
MLLDGWLERVNTLLGEPGVKDGPAAAAATAAAAAAAAAGYARMCVMRLASIVLAIGDQPTT